jgi:XTP/dITP diphosphohydrolase
MKLLLATRNTKKLEEMRRILANDLVVGLDDVPQYDEVPESGLTFEANARIKAREAVAHTGLPSVADDSGLAVAAMNGLPGVFSARWSGRHGDDPGNVDLLLRQLSDVPDEELGAAFVCAVVLVLPDGREWTVHGEMRGRLVREPRGTGGFGYDPIFVADGHTRTSAELTPAEKDAISHRGQAMRALAAILSGGLEP